MFKETFKVIYIHMLINILLNQFTFIENVLSMRLSNENYTTSKFYAPFIVFIRPKK